MTGPATATDPAVRLLLVVGRLVRVLRKDGRDGAADLGPGAFSALATLARSEPLRLGELAAREGVAAPTLTRIVALLEEQGYVRREPDPADRRAARVAATQAGLDLVGGVNSARAVAVRRRLAGLAQDDLAALLAALPVLERLAADEG